MSRAAHRVKTSTNAIRLAGPYAVYQRRHVTQQSRSVQRRILPLSEQDTPGLLQALAARVSDPRDAGGRIHPLPGLLAIAAVVSASSRVVEIVEWTADLPDAPGIVSVQPATQNHPPRSVATPVSRCQLRDRQKISADGHGRVRRALIVPVEES
ncbi:transposase family protein [Micromonospora sp. NPDC051227]|uniref:transposase family protein n=1 Tax=Micromonospora sp. NPDC051227 TaxID=3364285 RepID=UPI00379CB1E8